LVPLTGSRLSGSSYLLNRFFSFRLIFSDFYFSFLASLSFRRSTLTYAANLSDLPAAVRLELMLVVAV